MNRLYQIVLVVIAIVFVVYLNKPAQPNWYMVPYMGIVKEHTGSNIEEVHQEVFEELAAHTTESEFYYLTYESCGQCYIAHNNVEGFKSQLNNYRKRSLSTWCSVGLYKLGFSLWDAVRLPSMIAIALMVIVLFIWLSGFLQQGVAFLFTLLIMLLPDFYSLQEIPGPGAMSSLFVLLSLYLFATNRQGRWLYICLLLAVYARIDNLLLVMVVLLVKRFDARLILKVLGGFAVFTVLFVLVMTAIPQSSVGIIAKVQALSVHQKEMWELALISIWDPRSILLEQENYIYYYMSALIAYLFGSRIIKQTVVVVVACSALYLLLHPHVEYRFFATYNVAAIVLMLKALHEIYEHKKSRQLSA